MDAVLSGTSLGDGCMNQQSTKTPMESKTPIPSRYAERALKFAGSWPPFQGFEGVDRVTDIRSAGPTTLQIRLSRIIAREGSNAQSNLSHHETV